MSLMATYYGLIKDKGWSVWIEWERESHGQTHGEKEPLADFHVQENVLQQFGMNCN